MERYRDHTDTDLEHGIGCVGPNRMGSGADVPRWREVGAPVGAPVDGSKNDGAEVRRVPTAGGASHSEPVCLFTQAELRGFQGGGGIGSENVQPSSHEGLV